LPFQGDPLHLFHFPGVITPGYSKLPFQGEFLMPIHTIGLKAQVIITQWQRLGTSPQYNKNRAESPANFSPMAAPWGIVATPWKITATPWDITKIQSETG